MTESNARESGSEAIDNGVSDAVAATAIITLGVLAAIHFIYTGGLAAFFEKLF